MVESAFQSDQPSCEGFYRFNFGGAERGGIEQFLKAYDRLLPAISNARVSGAQGVPTTSVKSMSEGDAWDGSIHKRSLPIRRFISKTFPVRRLSHINARGEAAMVDVSAKPISIREAIASGEIRLQKATLRLIEQQRIAKGNVLATARLAGIQAAKNTAALIPLCHPLPLSHCEVNFEIPKSRDRILITASAKVTAQTGIEMEALVAVTVAALAIYDMCKAVDKKMRINAVKLVSKTKRPLN